MACQIVRALASIVILLFLVINNCDLATAKKDDNTGLVQLAQKDFGAFLQHAAESASKSIISKLNSQFKDKFAYILQEADTDSLQVWQGQILDLSVDIGNTPQKTHRVYIGGPQKESQWLPLRRMLQESQGGIRLHADWDAIESNLVRPLRDGAVLPDFTLEGPLDLFLTPPADLQLWLPHSVDAGVQNRVRLRAGVALTVRGARSVQLRRPIDLPTISLADFVEFALEDKAKHQAAGLMHLATRLREKATQHWNISSSEIISGQKEEGKHPMTPALVGLELDFSSSGGGGSSGTGNGQGTLFAAPDEHGTLQKLRVKRMGDGVLEISLRKTMESSDDHLSSSGGGGGGNDSGSSGDGGRLSVDSSKALVLGRPGSPYVWPFRSASPETVTTYEHLLNELLVRQVFVSASTKKNKGNEEMKEMETGGGYTNEAVIAPEVPLKLHRSSSTAVFLMKVEFAVKKTALQGEATSASSSSSSTPRIKSKEKDNTGKALQQRQRNQEKEDIPPTPGQLLIKTMTGNGGDDVDEDYAGGGNNALPRREVYSTVVKIEGNAREGLKFSSVGPLQLVERTSDTTATFDMPGAIAQVAGELGLGVLSNASVANAAVHNEL